MYINGNRTVNCGVIKNFEGTYVEVLGPSYSSHRDNIICGYFNEGSKKIEISVSNNCITVFLFRGKEELHHYWSRVYRSIKEVPEKYKECVQLLYRAYDSIFR